MSERTGSSRDTQARLNVAILGAGAWGTTLAILAHRTSASVTLIANQEDLAEHLRLTRRHPRSLDGVEIPGEIRVTARGEEALFMADVVFIAVPTQRVRSAMEQIASQLQPVPIISAIKGLELGTMLRPTQVIGQILATDALDLVGALSGPNLATEIATGHPAASVVASTNGEVTKIARRALMSDAFRVYGSDDVIGVEMGGALKNIIAIGAGIGDGLKAGDNAKAAFLTRGSAEIARLGVVCGANPLTFAGLSGISDLIATCSSPASRNHQVGRQLAGGRSVGGVLASMKEVAEGVTTTEAAHSLGMSLGIELPIIEHMYGVLFEGVSPLSALASLMAREPKYEITEHT